MSKKKKKRRRDGFGPPAKNARFWEGFHTPLVELRHSLMGEEDSELRY